MKVKKLLLSIVLIVLALFLVLNTETYAKYPDRNSWTLNAVKIRGGKNVAGNRINNTTKYSYEVNGHPVLKIIENGSSNYYKDAIYCLRAGVGFGSEDKDAQSDISSVTYTSSADMFGGSYNQLITVLTNAGVTSISVDKLGSILWILDNMYLPPEGTDSSAAQVQKNRLLQSAVDYYNDNNYTPYDDADVENFDLTDDDIEVVQQWALWYFTNAENTEYHDGDNPTLPDIWVSTNPPTVTHKQPDTDEWVARQEQANILYQYLVGMSKEEASNYTYNYQQTIPTTIGLAQTNPMIKKVKNLGNTYYVAGPFKITKTGNTPYVFSGEVVDQNGNTLPTSSYTICDENGNSTRGTLESEVGKDTPFYIRLSNLTGITNIKLKVSYTTEYKEATLWYPPTNADQPIVVVKQQPSNGSAEISARLPIFDLALRKYIKSITRDGNEQVLSGSTLTRDPLVTTSELKNGTDTTATYKHRKDPVSVQTGDFVKYAITIYNEGEVIGRATKIVDYLPDGLVYSSASNAMLEKYNFEVSADGRTITITTKSTYKPNLDAYTSQSIPANETIEFICEVTKRSADGNAEILTNVAEITQAMDANDDERIDDRDSMPNSLIRTLSQDMLPTYKGNSENKDDLTDRYYFYKGQQDDDDFEKLVVTTPAFDLALRKYITGVTRNGVKQNIGELTGRVPNVHLEALNTMDTTAEYDHRKDPVPVQTGDIVEYTIKVYNEGAVKGRATEIVDHLPEGLELVGSTSTNFNVVADANNPRRIIITPVEGYVHDLEAYNGIKLDSEEVKLTCKVTKRAAGGTSEILTNIAQITKCVNYRNEEIINVGDDRDSEPNNAMIPNDANLPAYKGNTLNKDDLTDVDYFYKGQQDDDDFEKLVVTTPEFDLALRKFITHIDGNEVQESRVPEVDTTPLKNKTNTTAIYTHPKNPLVVKIGSTVRYTIRVYNESELDGTAKIIEDYLPAELELVPQNESAINTKYGWSTSGNGRIITTTYLENEIIGAYDGGDTLNYKDVEVECRVKEGSEYGKILTNIAQINEDSDDDRDSQPNNVVKPTDDNLPNYEEHQQDDDDYEKVIIYKPGFDLALRKFITHIEGEEVDVSRVPEVDTTPLKEESNTTAIYTHPKDPLIVEVGDTIRYTIRVYNEGKDDGTATIIEDYLPEELEMVPAEDSEINEKYGWNVSTNGRIVTTRYLEDTIIKAYDGGDTLDYADVEIECRVKDTENTGKILTNIAQINDDTDDDRDSEPNNVVKPTDDNLPDYDDHQEDDDDFEKVKIYQPPYDLALRKFIVEINGEEPEISRVPVVDVTPLQHGTATTAIYEHPKDPLIVKTGDIVVYTIRVYNEGKIDGYAEEIKDNIPEGLEYIIDNEINVEYRWKLSSDEKQVSTDYLSSRDEDNIIKAFDPTTMDTLDYKDVKIAFRVIEPNTSRRILTNIAEIKEDDGKDIDSTPDNDEEDEDDIDVEHIKLQYFDLALRKFITKVESKNGQILPIETDTTVDESREPKVEIDEEGNIKYIHPKDPVIVANSDIVIYTLRVYNEGSVDGYANEIKDDVPAGLELVPEHSINVEYGWVMYDKDGIVTDNPKEAKTIRTTHLSEEKSEDNIIKAFDRETMDLPDYKEVKVAFKVVEKNVNTDRIIINTAEISKDSDDDEDSTPDNDEEDEDDIDKEYVKVKYFDLSLLKWVSKAMLTENGKTQVIETGYNGTENPEPIVKLELKPNQINSIVLKYEYGIKITNEGQIPGYATEVADYIPEGLEFIPEDNPLWTVERDGKIVTRQLENTLLQPGESAIITVVFKWKNSANNMGQKENWAEISEDANEKDAEDIDSTPDNEVRGEDDIDNALVILMPKTGQVAIFIILPTIILAVLATGIVLIKKYVI